MAACGVKLAHSCTISPHYLGMLTYNIFFGLKRPPPPLWHFSEHSSDLVAGPFPYHEFGQLLSIIRVQTRRVFHNMYTCPLCVFFLRSFKVSEIETNLVETRKWNGGVVE